MGAVWKMAFPGRCVNHHPMRFVALKLVLK